MKQNDPNLSHRFKCELCEYYTDSKKDYNKHINTKKHKYRDNCNNVNQNVTIVKQGLSHNSVLHTCSNCNSTFTNRTTLWRHKKKCVYPNENTVVAINNDQYTTSIVEKKEEMPDMKELIFTLVAENKDMRNLLFEQQAQAQAQA